MSFYTPKSVQNKQEKMRIFGDCANRDILQKVYNIIKKSITSTTQGGTT